MKIAVSTLSGGRTDQVFPRFGRCQTFTIVEADTDIKTVNIVPNPGAQAGGGAGIAAAQLLVDQGVNAVITGSCGPNAAGVLTAAGIQIYSAAGTVESVVRQLLAGQLTPLSAANAPLNAGKAVGAAGLGLGQGMGRGGGCGSGFGRGCRFGRGGGRGRGRGFAQGW